MSTHTARHIDASFSTNNSVGRDQLNYHQCKFVQADGLGNPTPSSPPFIDAPLDLLSIHFTGRGDELIDIGKVFEEPVDHGNVPTRCVIYGMHGIGKTQLTLAFAKSCFEKQWYSRIFWISATTVEKLNQGFVKLLNLVGHPDRLISDQATRLTTARRWLEESGPATWLLLFDNVDRETLGFLQEHLPRKNRHGNILFTTRTQNVATTLAQAAGQQHVIRELKIPNVHDAAKLFEHHVETRFDASNSTPFVSRAEEVVQCVGCLPLAVAHAASFMNQSKKTLDDLLDLYKGERRMEIISWENDLTSYEAKSVAATFASQLGDLESRSPDTSYFLKVLSFFDPESIPLSMVVEGAKILSNSHHPKTASASSEVALTSRTMSLLLRNFKNLVESLGQYTRFHTEHVTHPSWTASPSFETLLDIVQSPVQLQVAIDQLQNRSLVKHQTESALYMHDLIKFIVQENAKREGTQQELFGSAVMLACGAFDSVENPASHKCWPQCEVLIPHIQALTSWDSGRESEYFELTRANEAIALYLWGRGRYGEAEVLYERVLASRREWLGAEHADTLWTEKGLADVYRCQGRYGEAEILFGKVIAGRQKHLGAEHPDTLTVKANLAYVYQNQGHFDEAENLCKNVLEGMDRQFGSVNPETLLMHALLANIYRNKGRYDEAEGLYRRILVDLEKQLGVRHLDTLWTHVGLAYVYQSQGRYSEAESLYKTVLEGMKNQLGAMHPDTLWTQSGLADVYQCRGWYGEAQQLLESVLKGMENQLGANHPDTLVTQANLACVYHHQKHNKAETLYEQVLAGMKEQLGVQHPHTLRAQAGLANVYRCQGRFDMAEMMYNESLGAMDGQLGPKHPDTLWTRGGLANVYRCQGRYDEAKTLFELVLSGRREQLGSNHPDTIWTMVKLECLKSQGWHMEAETISGWVDGNHAAITGHV